MFAVRAKPDLRRPTARATSRLRPRGLCLCIERLEDRSLLSAVLPQAAANVTVMTQNLSLGADVTPVISALLTGNQTAITAAATTTWQNIQASRFPLRAAAIADEIVSAHPDLVGLQEAELFHVAGAVPAGGDYLQILLDDVNSALRQKNASYTYRAVATTNETDLTLPVNTAPGVTQNVELTDRDAILARSDVLVSNVQQQRHFLSNVVVPVGLTGRTVTVLRGWESVDVTLAQRPYRFFNTHLETADNLLSAAVQYGQALELVRGPLAAASATILVGDFNADASRPGSLTYSLLVGSGLSDAWPQTHLLSKGYTWPLPPRLVGNQRIDLVLFRGGFAATSSTLVGTLPIPLTALWPSDHAGVVAALQLTSVATSSPRCGWNNALLAAFSTVANPSGSPLGAMFGSLTSPQHKQPNWALLEEVFSGMIELNPAARHLV